MVKKQAFVVFLTVMSFIGSAFGLGLGDIEVKSNLNDPLDAEIELIQLQGLTAGEILPTLASNDDFRRAGVERSFFLANIEFRVRENDAGDTVITLSTRQAVREPFLNFLVEVNWPGGRLLKEYTVLLDPPVFDTGLAVDALVIESTDDGTIEETDLVTSTVVTQEEVTETVAVTESVEPRVDNLPEGQYRVQRNDTLWEIALRVPGRGNYSPQQVMLAIQDLNPEAFLGNNINRVKAGSVLTLPDGRQISTRTLDEAIAEVQAQNRGAAPNLREPVAEASEVQLSATDSTSSALPAEDAEKNPDGYLELTADSETSSATASGEAAATIDQLQNQLSVAEELNDQFERERDELESRVSELQEQIAIMERLLDVQNSDLAEVQQALGDQGTDTTADSQAATDQSTDNAAATDDTAATDAAADTTADAAATTQPAQDTTTQTQTAAQTTPPAAPKSAVDNALGFVQDLTRKVSDWVLASTTNMAITGGGLLLLILLPLYIRSKRGSGDQTLGELNAHQEPSFSEKDDLTADFDEDLLAEVEDDFDEDLGEDEPETLDAVVEAEMYMAYQKYDQAEEKLKEAFSEHPDRADVGLKLLEVYAETGDSAAFNELEGRLNLSEDQKHEVNDLRSKLPIGGVSDSVGLDNDADDLSMGLDDDSFDLDLDSPDSAETDFGSDLDFDFESGSSDSKAPAAESDNEIELNEEMDFDLDLGESTESDETAVSGTDLNLDSDSSSDSDLDFSLDLGDLGESTDNDDSSDDLDFSLDDDESLDLDLSEDTTLTESTGTTADDLDFSLDLDTSESVPEAEPKDDFSLDDDLSFDTSELDSSLDLTADSDAESDTDDSSFDLDLGSGNDDPMNLSLDTETSESADAPSLDLDDSEDLDIDFGGSELSVEDDSDNDEPLAEASSEAEASDPLSQLADSLDSDADLEEDEFDFLSGNDEASTKLDLARAYIEMDDKDGARDILEEVVNEGNDDQKAQAKDLMAQL